MKWAARRRQFRAILEGSRCVYPASVFDPLSARIAENLGFELGMFAGSTGSLTVLAAPDIIVLSVTEFVQQALRICRTINFPLMVDADHGYGNALNAMRTIEELEMAGVAGATIEDTLLPTPFGANGIVKLISIDEGVGKLRGALAGRSDSDFAVIGRTSALTMTGLDDAIARFKAYEKAGADALFIVGVTTAEQLRAISAAVKLPLILGSEPPAMGTDELTGLRVRICLQGHLPIRAAVQAVYDTLKKLKEGCKPDQISRIASPTLMKTLTRDDQYKDWIKTLL